MKLNITVLVSPNPIDPSEFVAHDHSDSHGAQILFFGVVRKENLGRQVKAVAYDAFPPLAESVLKEICTEACSQWGGDLIFRLIHRTGKLNVGEISLAIAVSSKHRDESYEASRFVIEELKKRAPVWKKEFYEDGESEWLKGHALCGHDAIPSLSSTTSV